MQMKKTWTTKTTFLLIFALVAISFMMYSLFSMTEDEPLLAVIPVQNNNAIIQKISKEKFELLDIEHDPFFGTIQKKKTVIVAASKKNTSPKDDMNWPTIQYNGMVESGNGSNKLYVLVINGKQHLFTKGETKDDVKLLRVGKDAIKVSFKGNTKEISL